MTGLGFWLSEHSQRPEPELAINLKRSHAVAVDPTLPEMAVIQGDNPEQLAWTAIEDLGGIHRFVSRVGIVLVKPNIGPTAKTCGSHTRSAQPLV
ncbi:MAG: hypothetical protein LAO24_20520 [Acidobacteriia bacterium]|nr:hypothetical protein [Terriglobia bacterium]